MTWLALRAACMALLLLLPPAAMADIYRWTDAQGQVHFSDTPDHSARNMRRVTAGHVDVIRNPSINIGKMDRQVPFTEVNGNMVVRGSVNGTPINFIVDTGSSLVVITPTVAKQAGIDMQGVPLVKLQTANGDVRVPSVKIGRLNVANLSRGQVQAAVTRISPDAHMGLLGMSFLSHYRMQVDHDRHILTLEKRPDDRGAKK